MIVLTVLFGISTVICAVGWFYQALLTKAIMKCIIARGLPVPTEEELDDCTFLVLYDFFDKKK